MSAEEELYERCLGNLLAVVHRDGGHHLGRHGPVASTERAMTIVSYLRNEDIACLRKQVLAYQKDLEMCRKVFYYTMQQSRSRSLDEAPLQHLHNVYRVAERCLKEMKQK